MQSCICCFKDFGHFKQKPKWNAQNGKLATWIGTKCSRCGKIYNNAPISIISLGLKPCFICINRSTCDNITRHNILYKWDSKESQLIFLNPNIASKIITYTVSDLKTNKSAAGIA